METTIKTQGWVVITPTLCQGDTMSWSTEENGVTIPLVFPTKEEAWKEIADDMIEELQQFIKGERALEDTSFGTDEYVAEIIWDEDDTIEVYDEDGNPIIETTLEEWRDSR